MRYAAGILGDPWTLVLLRDLMFKAKSYSREFLSEEAPASNILADRLERLELTGLITRRRDPERANQVLCELTQKGTALLPVLLAMIDWSARYDADTEASEKFVSDYRADPTGFARALTADLLARRQGRGGPAVPLLEGDNGRG